MKYSIYTDGGSRGNPGPGAIGVVVMNQKNKVIYELSKYLGRCTNNEAEYLAVLHGLKIASSRKYTDVQIHIDSLLVASQLSGKYKVKNERLKKIFRKIKYLEKDLHTVEYIHIKRDKNKNADNLVNEALDENGF